MVLLLVPTALAAGLSGLGVPEPLGAFAGPSAEGALGLATNPASALPAAPELALDLGLLRSGYTWSLKGEAPVHSAGWTPVPSVGAALPLGPVGLGLSVFAPYGRGGGAPPEESVGRFHSGDSRIQALELDLSVAARPHRAWRVGGALRVARAGISSALAYDTGVLLDDLLGPEAEIPFQDPFLEGSESYAMSGPAFGAAGGLRFRPSRGPGLDLAVRSPLVATLRGPFTLQPTDDLDVVVEGEAELRVAWPAEVLVAATLPVGELRLGGELGWTGWSSMRRLETHLSGLVITSDDARFQAILDSYGLSEGDFLQGLGAVPVETGLSDILSGGAWVDWLAPGLQARVGLFISPAAIPTAYVNPGNADFDTFDLRLAGGRAFGPLLVALSGDLFLAPRREVVDSVYHQGAGVDSGIALPPSDGTYALSALRIGLTAAVRGRAAQTGLW